MPLITLKSIEPEESIKVNNLDFKLKEASVSFYRYNIKIVDLSSSPVKTKKKYNTKSTLNQLS